MMKKRIKTGGALILAAVLAISAFAINNTFAADGVKDQACSLTVDVSGVKYKEVKEKDITINLYRVASIDVSGKYTVLNPYASVLDLSDIGPDLEANKWGDKALAVQGLIDKLINDSDESNNITPIKPDEDKKYEFTGLQTGMYLVSAEPLLTDYYRYDFTPYLISLPDNRFYDANNTKGDSWIYDVTVSLKPKRSDLYGGLVIEKELESYNESLGPVYFVFQVEASKTDIDDPTLIEKVYSDVVSLEFNGTGKESVCIEHIPAGSVVTVTEVYSGASYEFKSSQIINSADIKNEDGTFDNLIIIADEYLKDKGVAEIGFLNTYNKGLNGGNGIVNEFTYSADTKEWTYQAKPDSITTPEE